MLFKLTDVTKPLSKKKRPQALNSTGLCSNCNENISNCCFASGFHLAAKAWLTNVPVTFDCYDLNL